jgi:hypothetical protein
LTNVRGTLHRGVFFVSIVEMRQNEYFSIDPREAEIGPNPTHSESVLLGILMEISCCVRYLVEMVFRVVVSRRT